MLRTNSIKIEEIACALGYTDAGSFSRAFHRWENCNPLDWRIKNRLQVQPTSSLNPEGEQQ